MDSLTGKTGIAIHAGVADITKKVGKLLAAVHLQKLMSWTSEHSVMVLSLDGVERREPFYEAHFLECAPGEHEVSLFLHQTGMLFGVEATEKLVGEKKLRVTVRAGQVVHLVYTPGGPGHVTLEQVPAPT